MLSFTAGMYGGNSSSFPGTAAANVDAFAVAPYFGYPVPDTFTLDQLFQEMMSGGLVSGGYPGGMIAHVLNWVAQNYSDLQNPQYGNGLPLIAYEGAISHRLQCLEYRFGKSVLQSRSSHGNGLCCLT